MGKRNWFKRGKYNPCTYYNKTRGVRALVHGDDFVAVASRKDNEWFKTELQKIFEVKTQMMGNGSQEEKEGKILNRIVRVRENGWEYEANQRHAEIIIEELKLQEARTIGGTRRGGTEMGNRGK